MTKDTTRRTKSPFRPICLLLVLLPSICAFPFSALGQDIKTSRVRGDSEYLEVIKVALEELRLGNYAEAQAQFEAAHRLVPSARTLRGLGIVAFELRRYVEAERYLQAALADDRRPLSGAQRAQTATLLERTKRYLGTLVLRGLANDTNLLIDDTVFPVLGDSRYRLNLGDHKLDASVPGGPVVHRNFRIRGGQTLELDVTVRSTHTTPQTADLDLSQTTAQALRNDGADEDSGSVFASPWLWTTVGVVVAGAAVGTVLALSSTDVRTRPVYGGDTGVALGGR